MCPLFLKGSYVCPYILSNLLSPIPQKVMAGREDGGLDLNSRERRLMQRRIQQQQLSSSSSSTGEGGLEAVGQLLVDWSRSRQQAPAQPKKQPVVVPPPKKAAAHPPPAAPAFPPEVPNNVNLLQQLGEQVAQRLEQEWYSVAAKQEEDTEPPTPHTPTEAVVPTTPPWREKKKEEKKEKDDKEQEEKVDRTEAAAAHPPGGEAGGQAGGQGGGQGGGQWEGQGGWQGGEGVQESRESRRSRLGFRHFSNLTSRRGQEGWGRPQVCFGGELQDCNQCFAGGNGAWEDLGHSRQCNVYSEGWDYKSNARAKAWNQKKV